MKTQYTENAVNPLYELWRFPKLSLTDVSQTQPDLPWLMWSPTLVQV